MLKQVETCHCAAVRGGTEVLNMMPQIKLQAIMRNNSRNSFKLPCYLCSL